MWYYIRYAYHVLLTILQIIGLVLSGLGGAVAVLLGIGVGFSAIQQLLGYELLLTEAVVRGASTFGIVATLLGVLLFLLGLGATDPRYLRK